jgi:hypothetical protein
VYFGRANHGSTFAKRPIGDRNTQALPLVLCLESLSLSIVDLLAGNMSSLGQCEAFSTPGNGTT